MPSNSSNSNEPTPQNVLRWIDRYREAANKVCAPKVTPEPQDQYYALLADMVATAEQVQTVMVRWGWGHYYVDRLLAQFDFRRMKPPKPDPKVAWRRLEMWPNYPLVRQRVAEAAREVDELAAEAQRRADDHTAKPAEKTTHAEQPQPDPISLAVTMKLKDRRLSVRNAATAVGVDYNKLQRHPLWKEVVKLAKKAAIGTIPKRGNGMDDPADDREKRPDDVAD